MDVSALSIDSNAHESKISQRQALKNIGAILEAAGSSLQNIIKANVYLANMDDFAAMNKAYLGFFPEYVPVSLTMSLLRLDAICGERERRSLAEVQNRQERV